MPNPSNQSSPDSKPSPSKKGKQTPGVRGPGGPPPPGATPPAKSAQPGARTGPPRAMPRRPASPMRRRFEDFSLPLVERLNRLPRFLIIITPGILLFLGLIQTGPLAWLGGILLLLVAIILAWLTALSWPVITLRSKIVRVVVVLVVIGFVWLKFRGKF